MSLLLAPTPNNGWWKLTTRSGFERAHAVACSGPLSGSDSLAGPDQVLVPFALLCHL